MHFDLTSGTDAGLHVIYDPASVMHRLAAPYVEWYAAIFDDCARADVIAYANGGDGEARFRVFVDEAPPEDVARRAVGKKRGHLKVPSGRLFASGLEGLDTRGAPPAAPGGFALRRGVLGAAHDVPPGDYDVEAYDVDPESELVDAAMERAWNDAARRHPLGAFAHGLRGGALLGPILSLVTVIAVALLAILYFADHADHAVAKWILFESAWRWLYEALAALWAVRIVLRALPSSRAFAREVNVEAERHPLTVVVLTRRAAPPDAWQGVSFGDMDLPEPARPSYAIR